MAENVLKAFGTAAARGILAPGDDEGCVVLTRSSPPEDLAGIVDRCWVVRWDLRGRPALEQETLPFPCVNVVFGDHRPGIHGPSSRRFVARLTGAGSVLGVKLCPAGFHALSDRPPKDLVDRELGFSGPLTALDVAIRGRADDEAGVALAMSYLRTHHRGLDDADRALNAVVDRARTDATITRVADLASSADRSVRSLERLFRARIGVSPKWVIRRFRVQEAALRLASGAAVDLAALAQSLGYFDQSHFIRDFRSQVGRTPRQYATACAARR